MDVIGRATEAVGAGGRWVSLMAKADIRPGRIGEVTGEVERVEARFEVLPGAARRGGGGPEATPARRLRPGGRGTLPLS